MTSHLANDARLPRARSERGGAFAFPQARAWKAPNAARAGTEDSRFHSGGRNMTGQTSLTTAQRTMMQQGIRKPKTMDRQHRGVLSVMLVALSLTLVAVLGSGSPAAAFDDLPAGAACDFPLRVEVFGGNQVMKESRTRTATSCACSRPAKARSCRSPISTLAPRSH
jgi:hypothetical protein